MTPGARLHSWDFDYSSDFAERSGGALEGHTLTRYSYPHGVEVKNMGLPTIF